ncbi:MAG: hypothetical protein EOO38_12950, partial [Cytophagaceae bacterium]
MNTAEQDKKFQDEMQSYLRGEADCPDVTLQHFISRFATAQAEHETIAKNVQTLEGQVAEGRTSMVKLQGFLEGLAKDLRTLWDARQSSKA